MTEGISYQRAAWKRLKKNKGAVFGLIVIFIALLVALFGYFIAPDHSPYANRIIVEVGGRKPGATQDFVRVKKDTTVEKAGFFKQLFYGQEDFYQYIPITGYEEKADSII